MPYMPYMPYGWVDWTGEQDPEKRKRPPLGEEGDWVDWMGEQDPEKLYLGYLSRLFAKGDVYRDPYADYPNLSRDPARPLPPSFRDYWRSQYSNIYSDYQGAQAAQDIAGSKTPLGFNEWFKANYTQKLGGRDFAQRWRALAPWVRGERPMTPARWNIPW